MDKLPERIRAVRVQLSEAGEAVVTCDKICDALVKSFQLYARTKRVVLKRIIAQELATPLEPPKKRKEQPEVEDMNGSLRKMYKPSKQRFSQEGRQAAGGEAGGLGFKPEERPPDRLEDMGGIDGIISDLQQLVVYPLSHPEVFTHLGVKPPTGVMLHGPPGSGKSKVACALAGSLGVPFFKLAATEIVSGMSGESEAKIRQLFQALLQSAPSLLFLDEIDAIAPRRDSAGKEMERRIVAQLLSCMDDLQDHFVVVLAATNRPDSIDPALRRAGRFDREIAMGIPDEPARARILEKMTEGMRLSPGADIKLMARLTPGYVGADLSSLTKEAALAAISRVFVSLGAREEAISDQELSGLAVEMDDFHLALGRVQPSARREGFATVPDVTWDDVGALAKVRAELDAAVCEPIRKAEVFKEWGLTVPVGVLLFGPPGCGKTLLAKAAANASGANFIAIKGPELLNKYVGESERAVRLVFQRALSSAPCVIFFDELDALVPKRSSDGSNSSERVVNQMLTEMDGVQARAQVFVVAATNRPDILDPAMLRPGRLDRLLFVPLPSEAGRLEILRTHFRKLPLHGDVDLSSIAAGAKGFSGADLAALAREAACLAIRACKEGDRPRLDAKLLEQARQRISPSVGPAEQREYEQLAKRLSSGGTNAPSAKPST